MRATQGTTAPGTRLGCEPLEDRATPAAGLYALTGTNLVALDDAGTATDIALTGVRSGETIVGMDFSADGALYALGVNAQANTGTLYTVALDTGTATAVGAPGAVAFASGTGAATDLPPAATGYELDFNPSADQLRVVTGNGLNFRIDPTTGAPVDGNNGLTGTVPGTNPDGAVNGLPTGSTGLAGIAYTNSGDAPGGATTLYTLDAGSNSLHIQNSPSSGTQTQMLAVTLNGAPLDFTAAGGFDIGPGTAVGTSGDPATGMGLAALTVGGAAKLYQIDLATGAATELGAAPADVRALARTTVPPKTVEFTSAEFTATEDGTEATVTLTRTGDLSEELTVSVEVTGGTATPGDDFTGTSQVVTFAPGAATATATVPVTADDMAEGNETIILALTAPADQAVVGSQGTTTIDIADAVPPAPMPVPVGPVGSGGYALGAGPGGDTIQVFNADGTKRLELEPFGPGMPLGVKVATGDVTGDGIADVAVAPGSVISHVKVFDGATGAELQSFFAFDQSFRGGVSLATGDVNGDGKADLIVGAANGVSHVKVFDGASGAELISFFALPGAGGVNVAAGDVNGDGKADLIVGAANGLSNVRVYDLQTGTVLQQFLAYRGFAGGVTVAAADIDADGRADVITGTARGGSHLKAFSGRTGETLRSQLVFPRIYTGGLNVAASDVNRDGIPDVLVSGAGGTSHTRFYDGLSGQEINSFLAFGVAFSGGAFVG